MRFTPLPNVFFSALLPHIDDISELKVILHVFWLLYQKKTRLKLVTLSELLGDKTLMQGIWASGSPEDTLRGALEKAVERGVLLRLKLEQGDAYSLNSESERETVMEQVGRGEVSLANEVVWGGPCIKDERPNIFHLYEENIGLVAPVIADELAEAEKEYPPEWIEDAFKEAVSQNKRSWRYVSRILERWATEGRGVGAPGRLSAKDTGPEKYFRGKYGHLVRK